MKASAQVAWKTQKLVKDSERMVLKVRTGSYWIETADYSRFAITGRYFKTSRYELLITLIVVER